MLSFHFPLDVLANTALATNSFTTTSLMCKYLLKLSKFGLSAGRKNDTDNTITVAKLLCIYYKYKFPVQFLSMFSKYQTYRKTGIRPLVQELRHQTIALARSTLVSNKPLVSAILGTPSVKIILKLAVTSQHFIQEIQTCFPSKILWLRKLLGRVINSDFLLLSYYHFGELPVKLLVGVQSQFPFCSWKWTQ